MKLKQRAERFARIGRLSSQMHEAGRLRLTALEREQADLSDDLRAVFEALESGGLAAGAELHLGARRIRALQKRLNSLSRESDEVRGTAIAHGVRARLAGQAANSADKDLREREARKELAELVERALRGRGGASHR